MSESTPEEPPERALLVARWLGRRLRAEAAFQLASALVFSTLGFGALGIVAAAASFGLAIWVPGLVTGRGILRHRHSSIPGAPEFLAFFSAVALLIFLVYTVRRRRIGAGRSGPKTASPPGHASANALGEGLGAGPRLLFAGAECAAKAFRLLRVDRSQAATILVWMLDRKVKAVPAEIAAAFPDLSSIRVISQLRDMPGVIWLSRGREVLWLSREFRAELATALGVVIPAAAPDPEPKRTAAEESFEPPPEPGDAAGAWYAAMNLPPYAPLAAVKKRYRELVKRHHPDAVAGRQGRFGRRDEERIREINSAYKNILQRSSARGARRRRD